MNITTPLLLLASLLSVASDAKELKSPDGKVAVTFHLTDNGEPGYAVTYRGEPILVESRLGLECKEVSTNGCRVVDVNGTSRDETWKSIVGERSEIRNHYREMVIDLENEQTPPHRLTLTFRAYNEGIAFRHAIPRQPGLDRVHITRENTEFLFPADHKAWAVYSAQGRYAPVRLSAIKPGCERPLTVECGGQRFVALAEAGLVDYARMKFAPSGRSPHGLVSALSGPVEGDLPLATPWRVVMLAESEGELLENNDILRNLNAPCAIEDTSWIRPGKIIREVTLTTVGGKACVDFASKNGLQFVEFDAGWYGHEYSTASDATTVTVDPKRSPGPLDLPEVIRYAAERDIGIILYVNRRALETQLDEVLPLFEQWGVKGVKYGFVNVGSQPWTAWLHEAVRKAAEHRLMVDVHDEYRPTGYSRTYPNLMTQEGISGDETSPSNEQTLTVLFTRMLAGAGDNTICYHDARVDRNASHTYQLAKAVCIYSPWQFLYWYDRPAASPGAKGGAGGSNNTIGDEPELEFFAEVPTVWDETRVIHGRIGQYAVIARRSGDRWFIGCMNSGEARELDIPLTFLDPDKQYTAHVYRDDPTIPTRTHVRIDRIRVSGEDTLTATMSAQGGQAIRIE